MVHVPEEAKCDYAQMYLTGKADTWLRNSGVLEENLDWDNFCSALLKRFSRDSSYEVLEKFHSLKEGQSSVAEYIDKFEEKMVSYKRENPGVADSYYVKCFINGLQPEISHFFLKPFKPTSLYAAVETTREMELGAQARQLQRKTYPPRSYPKNYTSTQTPTRPNWNDSNTTRKEVDPKNTVRTERTYRVPGTCRYCGGKWFFGNKCAQYKTLNLMATEDNIDQEQSPEDLVQVHEQQDETTAPPTAPTEEEQCMQISS